MKLYSRVYEAELIDSLLWRENANRYGYRVFGVLVPLGRRAIMLWIRRSSRQPWRVYCALPYMRREDAIKAAMQKRAA